MPMPPASPLRVESAPHRSRWGAASERQRASGGPRSGGPWRAALLLGLLAALAGAAEAQTFAFGQNRVQYARPAWRVLQTDHVDVFYDERAAPHPQGRVLATVAAEAAEEAARDVTALFGAPLDRRLALVVYPTQAAFAATNVAELPLDADGIGGVTERFQNRMAVPFTGDWRLFRRVIHHETVHAVTNALVYGGTVQALLRSGARPSVPLWFSEGLAEYAAFGWDTQSDLWLRAAVLDGALPDIPRLRGFLAYRGGQGVWDFLAAEYGRPKVTEVLARLQATRSASAAIAGATGLSVGDLSARWHGVLREVYFPEVAVREPTASVGRPLATFRRTGDRAAGSPALSPFGDRVAYVAIRDGRADVVVAPTAGDGPPVTVLEGARTPTVESLRLTAPGLAWSPDGETLAAAATSGGRGAVAFVDVRAGRVRVRPVPGVDAVQSLAWSPDGATLALAGTAGAHADLFLLDVASGGVTALTRDLHGDHAPAWTPDGRALVFHSDRGDALDTHRDTAERADAGRRAGGPDVRAFGRRGFSLYRLDVARPERAVRLTPDDGWDATDAQLARFDDGTTDGAERLVFVSDRNGIPNLYAWRGDGPAEPLTDLLAGVLGVSLAPDGRRAALLVLDDGAPGVWLVREPLARGDALPDTLAPTVWAQRRTGRPSGAPALALASPAVRAANPLLRDAADGAPAPAARSPERLARADSLLAALLARPPAPGADSLPARRLGNGPPDTLAAPDTLAFPVELVRRPAPLRPLAARDSLGRLVARRYRLRIAPDLITATGSFDTVYGVQSLAQVRASDALGDVRVALSTNLVLDLRNADYVLAVTALGGRTDLGMTAFHLARELTDLDRSTVFRYRNAGLVGAVRYPLSRARRVDAELALVGVSLTDLSAVAERPTGRRFVVPRLTYTADRTAPGRLGPRGGTRAAASVSGALGPDALFASALADARAYRTLAPGTVLALRAAGGISLGPDPQRFYAAGVPNWLNASFASLPVRSADDFVFAVPVTPLRGFGFDEAAGDRFAVVNAELRVPLFAALAPGPLPVATLGDLHAVAFADAGVLADGRVRIWRTPTDADGLPTGPRVLDDVLLSVGAGLRATALGVPLRLDYAAPFDGRALGRARVLLAVGMDF